MSRGLCLHKKKILISIVIGFLGILVPSLCALQNVAMAAGSNDAVITSILRCVEGGQFKSNMKASDLKGNASSFMSGSQKVYVPLGFSGSGPDATLSMTCKELVGKALTNKGINIPGTSTNPDEKVKFLKSLGYKPTQESTASTKSCFWFKYSVYDLAESSTVPRGTSITQSICANVKDGKIADTDISIESTDNDYYLNQFVEFEYHSKKSTLEVVFPGWTSNVDIPVAVGDSWDNLIQNVKLNVLNKRADFTFVTGGGEYRLNYRLIGEDGSANVQSGNVSDINAEFTLTIDDASKRLITGTLAGGSTNVYPTFSSDDQFNMYQDYLRNYYAADIKCGATQDQIAAYYTESKGYYKVYSCTADDKMEPCYAKATKNAGKKVGGIDSARHFGSDCGFSCVANWLSSYGAAGDTCPAAEEPEPTTPTNNNNNKPSSGSTDDRGFCDEAVDKDGGIGAMQWILCPTLDNTTYTAGWIDGMTQKALEVDSTIYEPGSKLHEIWGDVRDIANVLMVLFFIVIVASQLTGRGIDNYGIKKMLPRLITMAIIVNLSYYICVLAVDVSNIAGEGLRDLFGRLGGDGSGETSGFVDMIMGLFGVGATGAGAAAGAASLAATLGAGGWVVAVVIVVVLVLVVIVALVVLWVMLGARLIIIILCLAISPLAFATFILPNTQNLFKKWWELLKAALIIFPICGAVAGMSATLKKLSLNGIIGQAGNLIIIILPYLVFFLLPILLKQAIAALGKVGGALTSLGNTVRNGGRAIGQGASKGVQNSQRFKDWSQYRQEQAAAQRAKRIHDRLSGKSDLTRRQQSQLRSADDILLAQRKKTMENESRASGEYYNAAIAKQDLAVADEQRATQLYNDPNYRAMMEQHGETSLLNEKEKMYSEQFASKDKVANTANLRNALVGHDAEQAAAAFTTLNSQGISEAMDEIYNANWSGMDNNVREKLLARMAGSNVDSFKSFAKYRQSGGQKSFKDWMHGAGPAETGVKDATFVSHLNDLKEHAMDTYSKDEMEFINQNAANSLQSQLGAQSFGSKLRSAAINSKEPKMQTQAEDMIRKQIGSGAMSVRDLGFTADNLGSARGETLKAIRQGYSDRLQKQGYDATSAGVEADKIIRSELKDEIAQAKTDQRIYNRMNGDVKNILGI